MRDEAVVLTPRVHRLSLRATGTPASGASRQRSGSASIASARAIARSATIVLKALRWGLTASICERVLLQTSAAERAPERIASRTSPIVTLTVDSAVHSPAALESSDDPRHPEETSLERRV